MQAVAYSPPLGVANAVLVIVGVTLFLVGSHTNVVLLGPSPSILFAGFTIDTWPRWSAVVAFSIRVTAVMTRRFLREKKSEPLLDKRKYFYM